MLLIMFYTVFLKHYPISMRIWLFLNFRPLHTGPHVMFLFSSFGSVRQFQSQSTKKCEEMKYACFLLNSFILSLLFHLVSHSTPIFFRLVLRPASIPSYSLFLKFGQNRGPCSHTIVLIKNAASPSSQ